MEMKRKNPASRWLKTSNCGAGVWASGRIQFEPNLFLYKGINVFATIFVRISK